MIYQDPALIRLLSILIPMPLLGIVFLFLAFRILKRSRSQLSLTLSVFYILIGIAVIINLIFLLVTPTRIDILLYILYFLTSYLILFAFIFIVVFIHNLLKIDSIYSYKKYSMIILLYGIGCFILLIAVPEGIRISSETNWVPVYSWTFLLVEYVFYTCFITISTLIYATKLYLKFKDKNLKKKLRFFILGILGMIFILYGIVLFNTWQDVTFKTVWSISSFFIMVPSALFIYYGIGQNL
ncbi:MAG: hypothetical protein ACFFBZ_07535 [Promethearchaeota archaeon]